MLLELVDLISVPPSETHKIRTKKDPLEAAGRMSSQHILYLRVVAGNSVTFPTAAVGELISIPIAEIVD